MKVWYKKKEAAHYMGVSVRTLVYMIHHPKRSLRVGYTEGGQIRIHKKEMDSYLLYKKPYRRLNKYEKEGMYDL